MVVEFSLRKKYGSNWFLLGKSGWTAAAWPITQDFPVRHAKSILQAAQEKRGTFCAVFSEKSQLSAKLLV